MTIRFFAADELILTPVQSGVYELNYELILWGNIFKMTIMIRRDPRQQSVPRSAGDNLVSICLPTVQMKLNSQSASVPQNLFKWRRASKRHHSSVGNRGALFSSYFTSINVSTLHQDQNYTLSAMFISKLLRFCFIFDTSHLIEYTFSIRLLWSISFSLLFDIIYIASDLRYLIIQLRIICVDNVGQRSCASV